jgi:hypothetical protein
MALNRNQQKTVMYVLIGALTLWILMRMTRKSSYGLRLRPIDLGTTYSGPQGSLFDQKYELKCTPGAVGSDSSNSYGLTPGGICGDQELIRKQMREYTIDEGIGGDLMSK